jgi:hypothetical protein
VVKTNDENTRLKKRQVFCSVRCGTQCTHGRQFNAYDVDVARDYVRVRHRVWVWDDAAVPRRGVVRAMRGVRSRHGDDWATRIAEWIQWPRSARFGIGVVVVDGDE